MGVSLTFFGSCVGVLPWAAAFTLLFHDTRRPGADSGGGNMRPECLSRLLFSRSPAVCSHFTACHHLLFGRGAKFSAGEHCRQPSALEGPALSGPGQACFVGKA